MMSVEDVVEILAVNLIGAVPDDEEVVISTNQGEPLAGDDTQAGQAFFNVCRRILGEEVPLLEFEQTTVFSQKYPACFTEADSGGFYEKIQFHCTRINPAVLQKTDCQPCFWQTD